MPLRLEIVKKLTARSERVKCCDFHPTEPWILSALYSGHIFLWNFQTQTLVKSIEVCDLPVRTAKFIPSKQWIVCGSDDMQLRVYNVNTLERLKQFEAHTDYIRSLAIHPSLPYVISSSDDMFIKLWDWDRQWECIQIFEGHTHYVMQVEFNPKDPNTFASASLDRTVKVWGLNAPTPHFSLEGHERGVNCIGYFRGGDRPYLVSGADDHAVKIWDYQTKTCVATLDGHTSNVSAVAFHPELPIILSGSEDGTVRVWHAATYRLENTLNYGMERVWTLACLKGSNKVAIGYDEGTMMIKIGHEEPVASMEKGGKIVFANNHEIISANVRGSAPTSGQPAGGAGTTGAPSNDGERLSVQTKDLGSCELYPQSLVHDHTGRLLCACGDGEYIIYTALALKNKSFGAALEFVWASESGVYATRESTSKIKVYKDFNEHKSFRPAFAAEAIFGGELLGIRGTDFVDFVDWNECKIVRRIDVNPKKVFWSESGEVVVLACETSYYVLRYNSELVAKFHDAAVEVGDQGIENSFELESEITEKVRNGSFVGDCFIYTNAQQRLQYYVGGEVMTLAHLPKPLYLLGYLPKENRVYLMDKQHNIFSYQLLLSVLVYQTAIVRRDLDGAAKALTAIPVEYHNRIARFLEGQDMRELALAISIDPEHRFELALSTKKLDVAMAIVSANESDQKWKSLGDLALNHTFDLVLAEECYLRANDLGGLLLLYSTMGDAAGMDRLAKLARDSGRSNIAFLALFLLHRIDECIELLIQTERIPEAAFLCRTYSPSRISGILTLWKENLRKVSVTAADALADPNEYEDKFPDLVWGKKAELWARANAQLTDARTYGEGNAADTHRNLIQMIKDQSIIAPPPTSQPQVQAQPPPQPSPQPAVQAVPQPSPQRPPSQSSAPSTPQSKVAAPPTAPAATAQRATPPTSATPTRTPTVSAIPNTRQTIAPSTPSPAPPVARTTPSTSMKVTQPPQRQPDDFNEDDFDVAPLQPDEINRALEDDLDDFKDFE